MSAPHAEVGTTCLGWATRGLALTLAALLAVPVARAEDAPAAEEQTEAEVEEDQQVEIDPEIFDTALEDFYEQNYVDAAAGFWGYIHFGDPSARNFEWAQFFLGECLRYLGLWHGAVTYYAIVAKTRQRPEILPDALRRLEIISRHRPISEDLVLEDLVYDSEFGTIPADLNQWVDFVQGLHDYKNGFVRWGDAHFEAIPQESYYGLKARYVLAVHALRQKNDDKAVALFDSILDSKVPAPDIKNEATMALGRLHFDGGRYREALEAYDKVEQISLGFGQAELLLEKAWAAYYLGETKRAMGYLHALDAPSYARFLLPDAFLLRGLILKELCHFIPAKRIIRAFRFRYGRTLEALHARAPMERVRLLRDGASQDGEVARRSRFIGSLQTERELIEDFDSSWEDVGLDAHLRRLYDFEISEQVRLWRLDFQRNAEARALELLEVREQIELLDYEIGLDIFKRLKAEGARLVKEEPLVVPYDSASVYYEFDGEYWNDELHSYEYFVQSRCFEANALGAAGGGGGAP